ncbi:FAD:protein FMN transferase [Candidatus Zixiibacteriota bacterium]
MESKLGKYLTTIFVIALLAVAIYRLWDLPKSPLTSKHQSRIMMDTVVTLRIYQGDAEQIDQAVETAFAEIKRLESLLSRWLPDSEISRINAQAGHSRVSVSPETWQAIRSTQRISRLTEGGFDLTIGAVTQLWDFQSEETRVPEAAALERQLQLMGAHQVRLDSSGMRVGLRDRGAAIDLGGAAKGYAVDRAIEVLREWGVKRAVVDAGGDIGLLGKKPRGETWKIGIRHPKDPKATLEVIEVDSGAVATSGNYERFFLQDGVRYHHILDPLTGMPANQVVSVTILADMAIEADILSTAVFVLGPQRGMTLIEQLSGVEGIIYIEGQGGLRRLASSGLPADVRKHNLSKAHLP